MAPAQPASLVLGLGQQPELWLELLQALELEPSSELPLAVERLEHRPLKGSMQWPK
ncbi:MAG: hypothetical protein HY675_18710 [Chloroflexi bacterium]|nr:hypothetical protein [Chloroflexota bacterium]